MQHFVAIEHRLASIEQYISGGVEQRALLERWQGRVDTTLETHGRRLDALDVKGHAELRRGSPQTRREGVAV